MIARWIHSECDEPITEIEFLLRNSYDKTEELEEAYDGVFELKGEQNMIWECYWDDKLKTYKFRIIKGNKTAKRR